MVMLQGRTVKACVFGRNEVPNTEVKGLIAKLRNVIVAITAMLGFSHFNGRAWSMVSWASVNNSRYRTRSKVCANVSNAFST